MRSLALLSLLACGPSLPGVDYGSPGVGEDDVRVLWTVDSPLVAGCCIQSLQGLGSWLLESTSKVPLDCDAAVWTRARVFYHAYPVSEPDVYRVEYLP